MNEIPTPRLILRPFRETDYDDLYEFLSQLREDAFEGYSGITCENGRKHLDERLGSEEYFAMELRKTGKVIGNIYCGKRDYEARELGFIVNKDKQRRGYALEALRAVIENAFQTGVHRLYAECDPRNTASWRLLEAAGLRREAHFRRNLYFHQDEKARLSGRTPSSMPSRKRTRKRTAYPRAPFRRGAQNSRLTAAAGLAQYTISKEEQDEEDFSKSLSDPAG